MMRLYWFPGNASLAPHMLLEEIGVAVTPGLDFDERRGHRFLRFSYAGTEADMAEAAHRLKGWARLSDR